MHKTSIKEPFWTSVTIINIKTWDSMHIQWLLSLLMVNTFLVMNNYFLSVFYFGGYY